MNYEKKYKEALAWVESIYPELNHEHQMEAEAFFPELKESENEKVRKHIISVLEDCWQTCKNIDYDSSRIQEDIAWLEKQGASYTKRDVDDAYIEGMAFAKDELEKQKPTWSEEDEERFQSCLNILQVQTKGFMRITETINTKWLKSLKQRYTWKPSKEQMDAMQMAVLYFGHSWVSKEQKLLESLYKDLKKLTEG